MKTHFITGGEGFVGYHLTKEILKDPDAEVVTYDSQKHYIDVEKSFWPEYHRQRVKELDSTPRVTRVVGDVNDRSSLRRALAEFKPQTITHLAALPIAAISDKYPEEAMTGVLNTIFTLLDVSKDLVEERNLNLEKLTYISSSMVYGDFLRDDDKEIIPAKEDQMCDPKQTYGAMKLAGEHLVTSYSKRFEIPFTIIRPSAVYGPTDCNRRVTEIYLRNALDGKPLILDNGGLHQLDFTYVKDLAQGVALAINSEKALGEIFNITRGEGRKIKDLAEVIKSLIPETKIDTREVVVHRPNRGQLDISKAKELLGYDPKYSLEEGMKKYLDFVKRF